MLAPASGSSCATCGLERVDHDVSNLVLVQILLLTLADETALGGVLQRRETMDFSGEAGNLLVSVIHTSLFGRNLSVEGINVCLELG